ncbi:MAG TPA: family 20 glycosylhydrolase [Phnomibacter sp.]|nr:family 20 glycosylhydrolase [Phnomibacter sp.]
MKKVQLRFASAIVIAALSFAGSMAMAQTMPSIIPQPAEISMQQGYFTIDANTAVKYAAANASLKPAVEFLSASISHISGIQLPVNKAAQKNIELVLEKSTTAMDESYSLQVSPTRIVITAKSYAGIFYGMQSLLQTLPQARTNAALQVPCMRINDKPRFQWRGMHLDVCRHFFSPDFVKKYIDLMAAYKLNTFHWHLVDDQGWRIEIKKYPKLTEVGAWRVDQNDKPWSSRPQAQPGEPATYGGYYTQEQIKEIVAYAKTRSITIVPEIEMPGHVASAIASYPQLSCAQQPQLPLTGGDYHNIASNYCPGNDSVYTFLQNVLTEVMALFPSAYIHLGGDEVDKSPWKKCARCQARIKKEGLKNEEELQSYFMTRMERFLISKKRNMIGWDEILEGGLAPEATVMSWRGEAGGIEAAKMNHKVVMTPGSPLYFDHYQAGPEGEPMGFGGMNTLKKVYNYDPIPSELPADKAGYILGAQANLWAEHITSALGIEYMILPRMLALSEVVWSPKEKKNFEDFNKRLVYHFRGFDQKGLRYSKGNFKVDIVPTVANGKLQATLSTEANNGIIYYTLDGSEPNISSTQYTQPIDMVSTSTLKAVVAVNGEVMGTVPAMQNFAIHKATGGAVSYVHAVSPYYKASGPNTLTDGVRGTQNINKAWHGFSGKDLIATIDLGKTQSIQRISIGCLQRYNDWIFLPQQVKFEWSADGNTFTEIATLPNNIAATEKSFFMKDFSTSFAPVQAKYVRVSAKVIDACPKGHAGEGKPGWVFADEIIVE